MNCFSFPTFRSNVMSVYEYVETSLEINDTATHLLSTNNGEHMYCFTVCLKFIYNVAYFKNRSSLFTP